MELSGRELSVLELLLLRAGKVVTKQQIVDNLYGWDDVSSSNAVEVFIYRLRKKLEASGADIRMIRGMGYLIEKPDDRSLVELVHDVALQLRANARRLELDLPESALKVLFIDPSDKIYCAVMAADGRLVAGRDVPPPLDSVGFQTAGCNRRCRTAHASMRPSTARAISAR